ncbi:BrnT family toxin [Vreelandella aquamarina]|uniref:Ribonuclease toxin, BrnT, of type II toxin-antitoxin system n=1 Tax=Vreelandella aquamarina TaxID=77097 RepID=A0A1N6CQS3_9GAMM|nr:BrnT family toxin [Halomonas meridiana]MCC4288620.1 BrnT family toxin [Halomonas meridiana]SIN60867.1 Ribonuclease toxin, BrnT, of type II toxin-antitoxin system [Halomonas meridiana]
MKNPRLSSSINLKSDRLLEIRAKSEGEPRFLLIGMISEKHWSAVVTYREERIRLISVRRSRKKEVDIYES